MWKRKVQKWGYYEYLNVGRCSYFSNKRIVLSVREQMPCRRSSIEKTKAYSFQEKLPSNEKDCLGDLAILLFNTVEAPLQNFTFHPSPAFQALNTMNNIQFWLRLKMLNIKEYGHPLKLTNKYCQGKWLSLKVLLFITEGWCPKCVFISFDIPLWRF